MRNAYEILVRKLHQKRCSGDFGVNGMIIIKWFMKIGCNVWSEFTWLRIGSNTRLL
jgi:hypothetical protein